MFNENSVCVIILFVCTEKLPKCISITSLKLQQFHEVYLFQGSMRCYLHGDSRLNDNGPVSSWEQVALIYRGDRSEVCVIVRRALLRNWAKLLLVLKTNAYCTNCNNYFVELWIYVKTEHVNRDSELCVTVTCTQGPEIGSELELEELLDEIYVDAQFV